MFRILGKEGTNARTPGTFFKSVVQATLLFGSETWVATPCIGRTLEGFHNWEARKLNRTKPQRQTNGIWVCPFLGEDMEETVPGPVEEYITRRQNTVARYIVTQPIPEICTGAERTAGSRTLVWWNE